MSDAAIRVSGLSKQYRIGQRQERYNTLRDRLSETVLAPARMLRSRFSGSHRETAANNESSILALDNISLEVQSNDVVGIIGHNGAGKSTLLKILSRITEPSSGYAEIRGRVGSLLEVGTGFHQELTGRENIFLNGAILGMKRAEIERNLDAIVSFAGVEKFIDTPVKRYSSGMYLRLAFAVAAHLETEILLVDEVLAVGDLAFQRKCLGKMEDVAAQGRTVLFVSHNLSAIKELCKSCIILKDGVLDFRGPVVEAVARYTQSLLSEDVDDDVPASRRTRWLNIRINNQPAGVLATIESGQPVLIEAVLNMRRDIISARLFCIVNDALGNTVLHQRIDTRDLTPAGFKPGRYGLSLELPGLWLAPSVYTLHFKLIGYDSAAQEERSTSERVMLNFSSSFEGISRATLAPPVKWSLSSNTSRDTRSTPNEQAGHMSLQPF